jgi:hypothetical protein
MLNFSVNSDKSVARGASKVGGVEISSISYGIGDSSSSLILLRSTGLLRKDRIVERLSLNLLKRLD